LRSTRAALPPKTRLTAEPAKLIAHALSSCDRLEQALKSIELLNADEAQRSELDALRDRLEGITQRWLQGSDCPTRSQPER
jgi:hypothetical protein